MKTFFDFFDVYFAFNFIGGKEIIHTTSRKINNKQLQNNIVFGNREWHFKLSA
jgi:hypothetical protein